MSTKTYKEEGKESSWQEHAAGLHCWPTEDQLSRADIYSEAGISIQLFITARHLLARLRQYINEYLSTNAIVLGVTIYFDIIKALIFNYYNILLLEFSSVLSSFVFSFVAVKIIYFLVF